MPPQPGEGLGPPPPPIPRTLPKGFEFRQKWSGNILALIGGMFFFIGSFIFLAFLVLGLLIGTPLPLLFMTMGFVMLLIGRRRARSTVNAFKRGTVVEGKVASVVHDQSQTMNGVHPWKLTYHFPVGERLHEGAVISWDSTISARAPGQSLWVLYLPQDPEQNTTYPPFK
jgi:hypothetical protein